MLSLFIHFLGLLEGGTSNIWQNQPHVLYRRDAGCLYCTAPTIKISPKNHTVALADSVTLHCRSISNPTPVIRWKKNNKLIGSNSKHYEIKNRILKNKKVSGIKSQLRIKHINNEGFGMYTCVASNYLATVTSQPGFVQISSYSSAKNIPGSSTVLPEQPEQCRPAANLSLVLCGEYLNPTQSLYGYDNSLLMYDHTLKYLAKDLRSPKNLHSAVCRPHIIPFLCYYNFPYCLETAKTPTKYTICRSDCKQLNTEFCRREFEQYRDKNILHPIVPVSCDELPETNCFQMGVEMKKVKEIRGVKTPVAVPDPKAYSQFVDPKDNCFYDDGQKYRGIENRTASNRLCLKWYDVGSNHIELRDHNYCRNIEPVREKPWCYVARGERAEYEYCHVPTCASPLQSPASNILYTIIPCLLFALLLSLAIIAWALRRHKQHFYEQAPNCSKQVAPKVNPKIQELNREDLCDYRLLGDGNFGRVYTADYTGTKDGRTFTICVAVKAIIEKATTKHIEDFVREAETRANFKHENVLSLIGVISKEEPLSLIYEYTEFGDLHEYLLRHSPNFSDAHANDDCEPLDYSDLLVIATQIASGMSYLSSHNFVHKDLAVRNCLVDNGVIKISDFSGLCDQYAGDYYRIVGRPSLPVRWMSPESLSELTYTSASDVYSFGVMLWEIFSYGSRPYFGLNNQQAMECVLDYQLLPCPDSCPTSIFNIMIECWTIKADSRPSFGEIYNKLKAYNDLKHCPTSMVLHPQSSVHSLPSTHTSHSHRVTSHDVTSSTFKHPLQNKSREHSLHSQSSNYSLNSHYHNNSIPPSLMSMQSPSLMGDYPLPPLQNGHHSLPRDEHHLISRDKRLSPHGSSSLPRDTHYAMHDGHYPYSGEVRSASRSSEQHSSYLPPAGKRHSSNGYIPDDGYIASRQSNSSSRTGSALPAFVRPDEYQDTQAVSVVSYDSLRQNSSTVGSHIYI